MQVDSIIRGGSWAYHAGEVQHDMLLPVAVQVWTQELVGLVCGSVGLALLELLQSLPHLRTSGDPPKSAKTKQTTEGVAWWVSRRLVSAWVLRSSPEAEYYLSQGDDVSRSALAGGSPSIDGLSHQSSPQQS